jgi:hypothetical protein
VIKVTEQRKNLPLLQKQIEYALVPSKERAELLRPGYTRLSLPFKGLDKDQEEYVCQALEWTSRNAWMLLCQYRCNHRSGELRHKSRQEAPLGKKERQWLSHYELLGTPSSTTTAAPITPSQSALDLLQQAMRNANQLLDAAKADHPGITQGLKMTEDAFWETTTTSWSNCGGMCIQRKWQPFFLKGLPQFQAQTTRTVCRNPSTTGLVS